MSATGSARARMMRRNRMSTHTKVAPATCEAPGGRGTERASSRRARHPSQRGSGAFPVRAGPRSLQPKEEPMSTDIIQIDLTLAERHTLHDLLTNYIDERVFEDVKFARYSMDLEKAAQRAHRL